MRLRASLLGVLLLLVLAAAGYAQSPIAFEQVDIELWPEYDRPEVLVIYHAQLPQTAILPARVGMPIPRSVGEPHAVAVVETGTGLVTIPYERTVEAEQAVIWVEADGRSLWLEYYDAITYTGDDRSFAFEWPPAFDADRLLYKVQQPPQSDNFAVEPAPLNVFAGQDGLTYHAGTLVADSSESASLRVSYSRSSDELTIDAIAPDAGEREPSGAAGQWLAPAVGVAAGVLLVVVVSWMVVRARRRPPSRRSRPSRKRAAPAYCHQCGTRAAANDRFCRQCGTELRRR